MSANKDISADKEVPTPRPGIAGMSAYVPGKSGKGGVSGPVYKLSANESALGVSQKAIDAYGQAAGQLHLYPDGGANELRDAIATLHQVPAERIICGTGSGDILHLLCQAYLREGDNIIQSAHGFLLYALAAQACDAEVRFAPETNLTTDVDEILKLVDERTRLVFIANPNNPTGTYVTADEIARLHAGLRPDILLVLDAAYAEYMDEPDYESGLALVKRHQNVVMTRTFSKAYGLGAIRLGWGYGPAGVIDVLNRIRGPFNVSSAAQLAGIAALKDQDFVARNKAHNKTERGIVSQRLNGLGLECTPSYGNFILVKFPTEEGFTAKDIMIWLAEQGVFVREMEAYGLPGYLRISIGSSEANRRVLDLLSEKFQGTVHE